MNAVRADDAFLTRFDIDTESAPAASLLAATELSLSRCFPRRNHFTIAAYHAAIYYADKGDWPVILLTRQAATSFLLTAGVGGAWAMLNE